MVFVGARGELDAFAATARPEVADPHVEGHPLDPEVEELLDPRRVAAEAGRVVVDLGVGRGAAGVCGEG